MTEKKWSKVDNFFEDTLIGSDSVMDKVLENSAKAGLPPINVSPCQGQMLQIFAMMVKAKRVLEIGTLGGFSTIWMANGLPHDGVVITLEYDDKNADVAEENFRLAKVSNKIKLIRGAAENSLRKMIKEDLLPFDMIFIDADKPNNPIYLGLALKLSKPGTVIVGDNVVRGGEVLNSNSEDPSVNGIRTFLKNLKGSCLKSTAVQTVGIKGYDGFSISIVD